MYSARRIYPGLTIGTSHPQLCFIPMLFNYTITDFTTFESDAVALELEEHEARTFGVRLANDVLTAMPELTSMGVCVVVYDIDEQPVSIVPLDPIQ
jgi:hypothetical protein